MIATSVHRVTEQTADAVNPQIQQDAEIRVSYFAAHPEQIEQRLEELDQEVDIERALAIGTTGVTVMGVLMGILGRRRWLLLPAVAQGFALQHVMQGWCPPMIALRRLGLRTKSEIEAERFALMALRGDFAELDSGGDDVSPEERADRVMRAVRGGGQTIVKPPRQGQNRRGGRKRRQQNRIGNLGGDMQKEGSMGEREDEMSPGMPSPAPADESTGDLGPGKKGIPRPDTGPTS